MSSQPILIICLDCEKPGRHNGRGLCMTCYARHHDAGTLHHWPSVKGDRAWQQNYRLPEPTPEPQPARTNNGAWTQRAACRNEDPELWFPVSTSDDDPQVRKAKAICRGCPALAACHTWVTFHPQKYGIWAATTPQQRRHIALRIPEGTSA
ncbi:WhiB family transcriptional regulator [Nonomuraea sp. NPDC050383]|uniref:WhiB family transcriptional regulator n=1 Tax=Nonomuraea sp. NPDC050383 TaxID=3364362 RepID=UPI0037BCD9B6